MKKFDLPLYSDTAFFAFSVGLTGLCVLRYYRFPLWAACLLALCLAVVTGVAVFLFLSERKKGKRLRQKDAEEREKLMLHLALSPEKNIEKIFSPLLSEEEKIYLLFTMQPLSADKIAEALKETNGSFSVWCNAMTAEAKKLCDDFSVKIKEGTEIYFLLKENRLLPEKYICGERKKESFREKIKKFTDRKNAKNFLIGGSMLLFFSLFSFFPVYYLLSGIALLVAALFIRIFG